MHLLGGCDGCLNRNLPPNMTPMLDTLDLLDILYDSQGYSSWLSRADFYALAGITAVEIGVENANVGCFGFNCIRKVSENHLLHERRARLETLNNMREKEEVWYPLNGDQ